MCRASCARACRVVVGGRCSGVINTINPTTPPQEATHSFYEACYLHLYTEWRRRRATIQQFGEIKRETQRASLKKPAQLLSALDQWGAPAARSDQAVGFVNFT